MTSRAFCRPPEIESHRFFAANRAMNGRYYVGEWLVEPEQNRLVRGSESAKLDPKAIQVLSFLADHPNEVLTKEQIFGAVWDGAFVSDEVLTTAIWGLRKALGDDAKEPRYIQTIPRKGYRLIAPVEGATGEPRGTVGAVAV